MLCSAITRAYLINYARTFIYTTAMGLPGLLSIKISHEFVATGQADGLRRTLELLIQHMGARLGEICRRYDPTCAFIRLQAADPQTPVLPIFTPRARSLARYCQSRGFLVRAIVAPTVPRGTDRVRICVHAGNSRSACDGLCDSIEQWVKEQYKEADALRHYAPAAQGELDQVLEKPRL